MHNLDRDSFLADLNAVLEKPASVGCVDPDEELELVQLSVSANG